MQIIENIYDIDQELDPSVIALGYFDGIHLGHQKLIKMVKKIAEQKNIKTSIFTFKTHPLSILSPNKIPKLLSSNSKKVQILESLGVDYLIFPEFTKEIMCMTPNDFVKRILVDRLNVKHVIIGFNYTFGYKGQGTPDLLINLGKKYDFEVTIIEPVQINNVTISSSLIRKLIQDGDIKTANHYLGRPYSFYGEVIKGKGLGKKISIPTANIKIDEALILPKNGVYHTNIYYSNKVYNAVTNVGINPSFINHPFTIETHILNFAKEIYHSKIEILFKERIRSEIKFQSLEDLILQIKKDIDYANNKGFY